MTGVVFEPFTAVQSELQLVDKSPVSASYARTDFHPECEAALNEQENQVSGTGWECNPGWEFNPGWELPAVCPLLFAHPVAAWRSSAARALVRTAAACPPDPRPCTPASLVPPPASSTPISYGEGWGRGECARAGAAAQRALSCQTAGEGGRVAACAPRPGNE